jgi:hypothetical protein
MEVYVGPDHRPAPYALETHGAEVAPVHGGIKNGGIKNVRPTIIVAVADVGTHARRLRELDHASLLRFSQQLLLAKTLAEPGNGLRVQSLLSVCRASIQA